MVVLCCFFSCVWHRILHQLWQVVVKSIQSILQAVPKKPSCKGVYHRLNCMLRTLKEFFYSGGNGIEPEELLENPVYKVCFVILWQFPVTHFYNNYVGCCS